MALVALLAAPRPAHAQRFTAEVSGTVVDETGGVIPGADVTLVNEASGSSRQSVTNADGFFSFSAVPAATYTVTVELQGFTTFEYTDIVLRAGDSRTLREIPLKVAAMAETVSVSAEIELTPLDSGERSATLGTEFIQEVPIVSSNAAELLRILPGMTPRAQGVNNQPNYTGEVMGINGTGEAQTTYRMAANQSPISNFSANGTDPNSFDITIDGAPGADPGCNCAASVNPNTEMVQEFKVLQASFGAEHARGPASMTVVSKSGGRDVHGSAFLYLRDHRLNANDWFANKVGDRRPESRFVYPGFTLSGPLSFGSFNKDRDKLFFFVGYEYYDQQLDTGYCRTWVPTAAMRGGDFSNAASVGSGSYVNTTPVLDGQPTPVIPEGMIDPGGRVLLDLFPLPNSDPAVTGGYNHVENLITSQPNHQFLTRLDWNISPSTKAFVRYNLQRENQPFAYSLWFRLGERQVPYPSLTRGDNRSDSVSASLTHVFDPTLTSETIVAFTYIDFPNALEDPSQVSRQGLGYPYQGIFGESFDVIPNVDPGGYTPNGPTIGNVGGFEPVAYATKYQYAVTQNFTKVWGTHTAKLGLFWERIVNDQIGTGFNNGYVFNAPWLPTSTRNTFADVLLGQTFMYWEQSANVAHDVGWDRWELYAQDSWKVNPRLTLSYGARISLFEAATDLRGNGVSVWDEARYQSDLAAAGEFPGVTWNARDPGVPVAGVDSKWAFQPRLGFAWDTRGDGETVLRGGAGLYVWRDGALVSGTGNLLDLGAGVREWEGFGYPLRALESLGEGELAFGGTARDIGDNRFPRTWSWSLTLNQRLPWSLSLEVGYVGNRSDRQRNSGADNRNAVPLGAMVDDPYGDPQAYRPLQAYGNLSVWRQTLFGSYHGLQALLARQRGSFNFTLAYTFSKAMGIRADAWGSGSEFVLAPFRAFNYGPLPGDRTHVGTGTFTWLLPGPSADGALRHLLGGWQVSGILSYVSGAPLPYADGTNNFNIQGTSADGLDLGLSQNFTGTPDVATRPVLTCDPRENVPDGHMFNPGCFAAPTGGQSGDFNFPYMKGQPYWNVDLSVFKNFDLGGDRKLQLRVSAYNVFNHPIAYPDSVRNLTLRFENGVLVDPGFGWLPTEDDAVRGDANKAGRRIVQLAVRFTF